MDIQSLIGQDGNKPVAEQLGDLFGAIATATMGDSAPVESEANADEAFTEMEAAASRGDREFFRQLVATESQSRGENEPTALMSAVMAGKTEVARALVEAGADVNVRIEQFFTFDAMEFAVDKEYPEIVKILVDAGAELNWSDPGFRPLTKAIQKGNVEILRILLEAGAEVEFETGFKPLVEAAQNGNAEIIQLLLDSDCEVDAANFSGMTALRNACTHCHVEVVEALIAAGADVNQTASKHGQLILSVFGAPMMAKMMSGLLGEQADPTPKIPLVLEALLRAGADVNAKGHDGSTPLMLAVSQGYTEIVQMLLQAGANSNLEGSVSPGLFMTNPNFMELAAQYAQVNQPLAVAVLGNHTEIVRVLLSAGANVAIADKQGRTALDIAIQEGYTEIIRLLEQAGATAPEGATQLSEDALLGAAKQGNLDVLQATLQAGINPNASQLQKTRSPRHKTALMFAAERGHGDVVQILLAAGADVNLNDRPGKKLGKTPLMYAAEANHGEVLHQLLAVGATVDAQDKRGPTALHYAVSEKSVDAVRILLEFGADPHKKSWDDTPFENATYAGPEIAQLILAADQSKGTTASDAARAEMLGSAAFGGDTELVRSLIQDGVNLNVSDESGWTALISAAAQGRLEIVQLLLDAGADIHAASHSGQTALSESSYWGHTEVVKLLIAAGANPNTQNIESGWTPLMGTLAFNQTEVVKILLEAGADPNVRNDEGKTMLELALEDRKMAIAQLLRDAGAIKSDG